MYQTQTNRKRRQEMDKKKKKKIHFIAEYRNNSNINSNKYFTCYK